MTHNCYCDKIHNFFIKILKLLKRNILNTVILLVLIFSLILARENKFLTNFFNTTVMASLLTLTGAFFIFLCELYHLNRKEKNEKLNRIKNLLYSIDRNLSVGYCLKDRFDDFSEESSFLNKFFKDLQNSIKKNNHIKKLKKAEKLFERYKTIIQTNKKQKIRNSPKYMEEFIDEIDEKFSEQVKTINESALTLSDVSIPVTFFTFKLDTDLISNFLTNFEELESGDESYNELRQPISELKQMYNIYDTNIGIILNRTLKDRVFYNATKCNIKYVHEYVEKHKIFLRVLFEILPNLRKFILDKKNNELITLRRLIQEEDIQK